MVGYPSGQRGQTVNLLTYVFAGSNPAPTTTQNRPAEQRFCPVFTGMFSLVRFLANCTFGLLASLACFSKTMLRKRAESVQAKVRLPGVFRSSASAKAAPRPTVRERWPLWKVSAFGPDDGERRQGWRAGSGQQSILFQSANDDGAHRPPLFGPRCSERIGVPQAKSRFQQRALSGGHTA